MTFLTNLRTALLLCLLTAVTVTTHAQGRGPGGGGPPGGGPPGGGPGGIGGPMMSGNSPHADRAQLQSTPRIRTEPQITLRGRWWDDKKTVKSVKLRSEQQQRMDQIFDAGKATLITLYQNFQREQERFVTMPREDLQDEAKVFAEIDRVAQARAEFEKANFHLLLQIRKEMDPDQLAALDRQIANAQ